MSSSAGQLGGSSLVEFDTPNPYEIPLDAAKAGTLSTRTDNDTGIVTVPSGHGITTADKVDLYSSDGLTLIRKDMDVTATTSTTISIDAGSGSNLPVLTTAVAIAKQKVFTPTIVATGIKVIGFELSIPGATTIGRVKLLDDAAASVMDKPLTANNADTTNVSAGASNPLSDDAASGRASQGNTTIGGVLKIQSWEDRTP